MKKKILKKGLIMLIVCILSIGSAFSAYAACVHTFNGSFDTIQPTCADAGAKIARCTKCGVILQTITIPALGHNYVKVKSTSTYILYRCSRCGDDWYKNI